MRGTRRFEAPERSAVLALACCLAACAVGVDGVEEPLTGDVAPDAAFEAGVVDTGVDSALPPWLADPQYDAGTSMIAPALDASRVAPAASDASRPTRTSDASSARPARSDAATGSGGSTRCQAASCTNSCSLAGPIKCCTESGSCGCSWSPGAYCL